MNQHDYELMTDSRRRICVVCGHVEGNPDYACEDAKVIDPHAKAAGWRAFQARAMRQLRLNSEQREAARG